MLLEVKTEKLDMHALEKFVKLALDNRNGRLFRRPFDNEWRSLCEHYQEKNFSYWSPVKQEVPVSFAGLENALEIEIHPDIKEYYGTFWSGSLEANCSEGPLSLIQLWNEQDYDRLIENLIGHSLNKKKLGAPFTVFFATTDPGSEYFLSIENITGGIVLEEPTSKKIREIDSGINTFLERIAPTDRETEIY